jgi:GTP cyclohydrolase I
METKPTNPQDTKYQMTWAEFHDRVVKHIERAIPKHHKVYGIPRGGVYVAIALHHNQIVQKPEDADIFVDDIIASGETEKLYKKKYGRGVLAVVDKVARKEDAKLPWIVFPWERVINEAPAEHNVTRLLEAIGEDPSRPGLKETPERVVKALKEMTSGYQLEPKHVLKLFPLDSSEMVIVNGIQFSSLCEHHLLPFSGTVSAGYIPSVKLVGLSKIPRLVTDVFAPRLQTQERLTSQIANAINDSLQPKGVGVVVRAHHSCMGCRGAKQPNAEMVTSSLLGIMLDLPEVRAEFLGLTK